VSITKGCLGTVGGILVLFTGCAYLYGNSYNKVTKESAGEAPIEDTSWVPSGYSAYNNNVAYKWSEGGYTCTFGRCAQIEIYSKEGCSSLYVEANKMKGTNNVGFTNATTTNLAPLGKAVLKLESGEGFDTFQISKISCY
jgi:hypothetical protein